jgi:predicted RND superfamily exporter protein
MERRGDQASGNLRGIGRNRKMNTGGHDVNRSFARYILDLRKPIGLILVTITIFMGYWAIHLPIATRFEDLFPAKHPNTLLYRQFRRQYGGAQTLVMMVRVKNGDIFNFKTLHDIQDTTNEVDKLFGVNHNEVFSLASYRLLYARALPGELVSTPFMYPKVPDTQSEIEDLKNNVRSNREQLAAFVTPDDKGALIIASFNEQGLDYKTLFDGVQAIIDKHQDSNTDVYASGAVMFSAWGYHYLPRIQKIFVLSTILMLLILYLSLGRYTGWWAPMLTGVLSSIWGLGFASLMGFNFDPIMLVIPFIMTARDVGHGIQWQGRYYDEIARTGDKIEACVSTADSMLRPGILAVLANVAGIVFITVGDIPVLREIGIGGAVWMGASVAMVFVFQPILASYLPRPEVREDGLLNRLMNSGMITGLRDFGSEIVMASVTSGASRRVLIGAGALALVVGIVAERKVPIGYQTAGTPIYRPDARINRDTAQISKFVPTNIGWIVLETPEFPSSQSGVGIDTLRMSDDLANYLMGRGDVVAVLGFSALASKPMNMLLHNGQPKYYALPDSDSLSASLWGFFFAASAPGEAESYFAISQSMRNSCIRVMLPDHTYARLKRLRTDIDHFIEERVTADPALNQVKLRYIGGEAGLYLAADDVIGHLNLVNLSLTLAAICLACALFFRSVVAGVLFGLSCVAANFLAFVYMDLNNIGLTVDTLPVISLGVGLGVDYAVYTVARIRDEVIEGLTLNDAIALSLRSTGVWVFCTFAVMVGGILAWVFSPLLFHSEMSMLLILLMSTNLIAGLLLLPALISWVRPAFITRYERGELAAQHAAS